MEAVTAAQPSTVRPGFWRDRRVLLTGHTGFKGAWLSLWLQHLGADLTGFSRSTPTPPALSALARTADQMTGLHGDIRDHQAVARAITRAAPEVVFHLAGQPLVRRAFAEPRQTFETNVIGTVNLLDAVRAVPSVRVVIVVTTDRCYEYRDWDWGYREDEPLGGDDPYAASKACAEFVASAYRRSYFAHEEAPRLATVRAGNVIGGGDWGQDRLVPDLARASSKHQDLKLRNPNAIRPWQHVLNPLAGYLLLAQHLYDSAAHAGPWNFGPPDEDACSVSQVVDRLAARWPARVGWTSDPGPHPHEARYLKLDSSRARQRLGWRPTVGLDDALDSVADWHRALGEGADMRAYTLGQIQTLAARADGYPQRP